MEPVAVQLKVKQIIDHASSGEFERSCWEDAYREWRLQVQAYNPGNVLQTWDAIKRASEKAAFHVPYKTAYAIGLHIKSLGDNIPIAMDLMNEVMLPFSKYQIEILSAEINNLQSFKMAIIYSTPSLCLLGMQADRWWLSTGIPNSTGEPIPTFMVATHPNISITSYQKL